MGKIKNQSKIDYRVKDFVRRITKKYKITKLILFGSRARGDYLKNSDYDFIIVSPDFKGKFFTKRIAEMYDYWRFFPINIEPICYTPEEFEEKKKQIGTVRKALKEGIEII